MDQDDDNTSIDSIEAGDPSENLHDMLNEMDTDSEEPETEKEPEQKE
jgi:hypothetical protein